MAEQKITDLSYLHEISMGDDRLITEMITLFLENTPLSIENLKTLTYQGDWPGVAAISHKLKPNLVYMGLNSASEILEKLEEAAKTESNLLGFEDQITLLERICEKSYKELNHRLKELRS